MTTTAARFRGWRVVWASFAILFAGFGTAYAFGAFFTALSETFGASRALVSAVFSYAACLIFLAGAVSGPLADRFGPRPVVAIGLVAIVSGLIGGAHAITLGGVTVWFTLGVGAGVGFVYVPSIGAVQRWFVRRRGLASGIAVTGIGVGTLLVPAMVGLMLEAMSWRGVFVTLAVMVGLIGGAAVTFVYGDPAGYGLQPDGDTNTEPPQATPAATLSLKTLMRSRSFAQLYFAQAAMSFAVLVPFVHVVPHAEDLGIERSAAAVLLSIIGLGSTVGRVLLGGFADRLGRGRSLVGLFTGLAMSYAIWLAADGYDSLVGFTIVFGLCYGGYIALMPALLADYFAGPRLSSVIGVQYTSAAIGSLLGPITAGFLFDRTGAYSIAIVVTGLLAAAAAVLMGTLPAPPTAATKPR